MVLCPICKSATASVVPFDFASTTVVVETCEGCRSTTGIASVEIRKSGLVELKIPSSGLRHSEGLVVFG